MMAHQGLSLSVTDDVKDKLVDLGYSPQMGARPLRRVIQEQLEDNIADYYLEHPSAKIFEAKLTDDQIKIDSPEIANITKQTKK